MIMLMMETAPHPLTSFTNKYREDIKRSLRYKKRSQKSCSLIQFSATDRYISAMLVGFVNMGILRQKRESY